MALVRRISPPSRSCRTSAARQAVSRDEAQLLAALRGNDRPAEGDGRGTGDCAKAAAERMANALVAASDPRN